MKTQFVKLMMVGLCSMISLQALACQDSAFETDRQRLERLSCEVDRDEHRAEARSEEEAQFRLDHAEELAAGKKQEDIEAEKIRMREEAALTKIDMGLVRQSVGKCNDFVLKGRLSGTRDVAALFFSAGFVLGGVSTTLGEGPSGHGVAIGWSIAAAISAAGGGYILLDMVQSALRMSDFPKLAQELGADEEGLVTRAYLTSCQAPGNNCRISLDVLKKDAKTGHMCEGW